MNRRNFLVGGSAALALLAAPRPVLPRRSVLPRSRDDARPHVLMIVVDDLNDWIGCLGGHPDVRTPHIDRLAERGVLFTHAYCSVPVCAASRASVLTGLAPTTSGVYANDDRWKAAVPDAVTLPQALRDAGFATAGYGKLFHGPSDDVPAAWDDRAYKATAAIPWAAPFNPLVGDNRVFKEMDWGPVESWRPGRPWLSDRSEVGIPAGRVARLAWMLRGKLDRYLWSTMDDAEQVDRAIAWLGREHARPFFLGCGLFRPHLPWYVPTRFFEQYPRDEIALPVVRDDDLDDVPEAGRRFARPGVHRDLVEEQQWRPAVQAYLASISFADEQVGRLLAALEASPHAERTLVVLWSDHGFSLGEKLHWRKHALWEEATRAPLIFAGPGVAAGARCQRTVSLVDLYPTLLELCGVTPPASHALDGRSLAPLLADPAGPWERPAVMSWQPGNHSVRSEGWRFTRYADGSEELYDHTSDPQEWTNLAGSAAHAGRLRELAKWLPREPAAG